MAFRGRLFANDHRAHCDTRRRRVLPAGGEGVRNRSAAIMCISDLLSPRPVRDRRYDNGHSSHPHTLYTVEFPDRVELGGDRALEIMGLSDLHSLCQAHHRQHNNVLVSFSVHFVPSPL